MLGDGVPAHVQFTLLNNLAVAYGVMGNADEGINYCFQALALAEEELETKERLNPLINLSSHNYAQNKVDKALESFAQIATGHFFYTPSRQGLGQTHRQFRRSHYGLGVSNQYASDQSHPDRPACRHDASTLDLSGRAMGI